MEIPFQHEPVRRPLSCKTSILDPHLFSPVEKLSPKDQQYEGGQIPDLNASS